MLRSLFSAISGLQAHQTKMDVVGNNIANVNTVGYKSSTTVFEDTLSQMLRNGSAPTATPRGTNPAQVGLGVKVAEITTNFSQGSTQSTGRASDFMISGDGFFVTKSGNQQLYTRAGSFDFDGSRPAGHPGRQHPAGLDGRPTARSTPTARSATCRSPSARRCRRWPRRTARSPATCRPTPTPTDTAGPDPGHDVRPAGQRPPGQLRLHRHDRATTPNTWSVNVQGRERQRRCRPRPAAGDRRPWSTSPSTPRRATSRQGTPAVPGAFSSPSPAAASRRGPARSPST